MNALLKKRQHVSEPNESIEAANPAIARLAYTRDHVWIHGAVFAVGDSVRCDKSVDFI